MFLLQAVSLSSGYVVFAKSTTYGGQLVAQRVTGELLWSLALFNNCRKIDLIWEHLMGAFRVLVVGIRIDHNAYM